MPNSEHEHEHPTPAPGDDSIARISELCDRILERLAEQEEPDDE